MINTVVPAAGQVGSEIRIEGANLQAGADRIETITLGGVVAAILEQSNTHAVVRVHPGRVVGPGDVRLVATTGAFVVLPDGFRYLDAGDINSVVPSQGQYRTIVTISGFNLLGGGSTVTSLTLAGIPVGEIQLQTDSVIRVVVAPATAHVGDIVIQTETGAVITRLGGFEYLELGDVEAVSPSTGQYGTEVSIRGQRLLSGGASVDRVVLAGVDAVVSSSSDTEVVVVASESVPTATLDVVLTADTGAEITEPSAFRYIAEGVIGLVAPAEGQRGTFVEITGQRLRGSGGHVIGVVLAGTEADLLEESDVLVKVRALAAPAPLTGDVVLTADSGAIVTKVNGWTHTVPGAISIISPAVGQLNTAVTIRGSSLLGGGTSAVLVTLLGVPATIRVGDSDDELVVVAAHSTQAGGSGSSGLGSGWSDELVTILSDTGSIVEVGNGLFEYAAEGEIAAVTPSIGQYGTRVAISGSRLQAAGGEVSTVRLAGTLATITSQNNDLIEVLAAAAPGAAPSTAPECASSDGPSCVGFAAQPQLCSVPDVIEQCPHFCGVCDTPTITGDVVLTADTEATVTLASAWTYATEGTIGSVEPSSGQLGTVVEIAGLGLWGAGQSVIEVILAGTEADIQYQSDTLVRVVVRDSAAAAAGSVVLTANSGAIVSRDTAWEYLQLGAISTVTPSSGQQGTAVTILGSRMLGGGAAVTSVTLGGILATVVGTPNNGQIDVIAEPTAIANVGAVEIISNTGSIVTLLGGFEYLPASEIASIAPNVGQAGTYVTIAGSGLLGGADHFVSIMLGGTAIRELVSGATRSGGGDDQIVVRADAPFAVLGTPEDVHLTTDTSSYVIESAGWSYEPASTIVSLLPASGQEGTRVTITGTNLLGASNGIDVLTVELGGVLSVIESVSQTEIVVIAQASAAAPGTGRVYILVDSGADAFLDDGWEFLPQGAIAGVSPSIGHGSTLVTITGTNLLGGGTAVVEVTLDVDVPATGSGSGSGGSVGPVVLGAVVSSTDTTVLVEAADFPAATVLAAVKLTTDTGAIIERASMFQYGAPGVIQAITPSSGQYKTVTTIVGNNLRGYGQSVDEVTLAGVGANIESQTDSEVVVTAAANPASVGDVQLVANTGAKVTLQSGWSYETKGEVASVQPTSGQYGTEVTISGSSLQGHGGEVVQVTLGGYPVQQIVSETDTVVVVEAAAGPAEETAGAVVLTADTGAIVTTASVEFTYLRPAEILNVNPNEGRVGSRVTIVGAGLCGGGAEVVLVTLATVPATLVDVSSCNRLIVEASDYGASVTGVVALESNTGAKTSVANAWSYIAAGEITSVSPTAGQGNTLVTIVGTSLYGGGETVTTVTFAGVPAFITDAGTETQIIVRTLDGPGAGGVGDVLVTGSSGVLVRAVDQWTYSAVLSVSPDHGMRGTRVTISGVAMLVGLTPTDLSEVRLGGVLVASVDSVSGTEISVVAQAESTIVDQTGDVTILMNNGQITRLVDGWTYKVPGNIATLTPNFGQVGTRVRIAGTELLGYGASYTSVTLSGVEPTTVGSSNTHLDVIVAAGSPGNGDVVLVSNSGSIVTALLAWTYTDVAVISTVSPGAGQLDTTVTISGDFLYGGGTSLAGVTLAGVAPSRIVSESNDEVVVIAASALSNNICPIVCDGSCATCSGPTATECLTCPGSRRAESDGSCSSICDVVDVGTFRADGSVTVAFSVDFAGVIESGFSGAEVSRLAASVVSVMPFASTASVITVGSLSGPDVGVTVAIEVTVSQINFEVLEETVVTIVTGSSGGGSGSGSGGSTVSPLLTELKSVSTAYFYVTELPIRVAGIDVAGTCQACDLSCGSCNGAGAADCASCPLDDVFLAGGCLDSCPTGYFADPYDHDCKPSDCEVGDVVLISDTGSTVSLANSWKYVEAGAIASITPSSGQRSTPVRIEGTFLRGAGSEVSDVSLAGFSADIVSQTDSAVEVIAIAGVQRTGDVVLTSDTGSTITKVSGWEYLRAAAVTGVNPSVGQFGTRVTITGNNLLIGGSALTSIEFGGVAVDSVISQTDNTLIVVLGDSSAGEVRVPLELTSWCWCQTRVLHCRCRTLRLRSHTWSLV